jgi:hypothetical protein
MPYHEQASVRLAASSDAVFAFIDDPVRLSGHMRKRSLLMGGNRMNVETDALKGRAPGSRTRLSGRLFGLELEVQTEVVERNPPRTKAWRSVGEPRLLVIGPYAMSVTIEPLSGGCGATVAIDYELPGRRLLFAMALARVYARWCVRRMVLDITAAFPAMRPAVELQR